MSNLSTALIRSRRPIRRVLVTRSLAPRGFPQDNTPYGVLEKKYNIAVQFIPFVHIKPLVGSEFRAESLEVLRDLGSLTGHYTGVIFTSCHAIHYFLDCAQTQYGALSRSSPLTWLPYFCLSKPMGDYLANRMGELGIRLDMRGIFCGSGTAKSLLPLLEEQACGKSRRYLFPCSDRRREEVPEGLGALGIVCREWVVYRTCYSDLSRLDLSGLDLSCIDLLVFFSPSGVGALLESFPNFEQGDLRIAALGSTTASVLRHYDLVVDIVCSSPNVGSLVLAIEKYIIQSDGIC